MIGTARQRLFSFLLAFALPTACGGSSSTFDERNGDAGEPSTGGGGTNAGGSGGTSAGGSAGTTAGGSSGTSAGGADTGGSGGTASGGTDTGGSGGTGGTATGGTDTGGSGGTIALGGTGGASGASTGGFGGQVGGSTGAGGTPDSRCPARPPMGVCQDPGLSCRYDMVRQCLCMVIQPPGICTVVDPRCTAMAAPADRILPPDGGAGIAIPVSTGTCTCTGGSWLCTQP